MLTVIDRLELFKLYIYQGTVQPLWAILLKQSKKFFKYLPWSDLKEVTLPDLLEYAHHLSKKDLNFILPLWGQSQKEALDLESVSLPDAWLECLLRHQFNLSNLKPSTLIDVCRRHEIGQKELLQLIKLSDVTFTEESGETALSVAIYHKWDLVVIQALVEAGSDLEATDRGNTVFLWACRCSNSATLLYLIPRCDLNATDEDGNTALHLYLESNDSSADLKVVQAMVTKNPFLPSAKNKNDETFVKFCGDFFIPVEITTWLNNLPDPLWSKIKAALEFKINPSPSPPDLRQWISQMTWTPSILLTAVKLEVEHQGRNWVLSWLVLQFPRQPQQLETWASYHRGLVDYLPQALDKGLNEEGLTILLQDLKITPDYRVVLLRQALQLQVSLLTIKALAKDLLPEVFHQMNAKGDTLLLIAAQTKASDDILAFFLRKTPTFAICACNFEGDNVMDWLLRTGRNATTLMMVLLKGKFDPHRGNGHHRTLVEQAQYYKAKPEVIQLLRFYTLSFRPEEEKDAISSDSEESLEDNDSDEAQLRPSKRRKF